MRAYYSRCSLSIVVSVASTEEDVTVAEAEFAGSSTEAEVPLVTLWCGGHWSLLTS